jgi:hypothetical protein
VVAILAEKALKQNSVKDMAQNGTGPKFNCQYHTKKELQYRKNPLINISTSGFYQIKN